MMDIKSIKFNPNMIWFGLLIGLIMPLLFFVLFFNSTNYSNSISAFMSSLSSMQILYRIISVCVIPNLLFFYLFIWKEKLYAARGVLLSTLIYAIGIFILYFIA